MSIKHAIAAAIVSTAAFAAAGTATAEPYAFRFKSYELETKGGRADLMSRLDRFVGNVCETDGARSLASKSAADKCKADVKAEIMAKIDNVAFASLN
ncbi:MAG: UrcA family protein [Parvularculaceae bacterium]|nr:UrcA family protein [Parvularculaceae bacterium]